MGNLERCRLHESVDYMELKYENISYNTGWYFVDWTHWKTFADMFLAVVNTVMHL
jgi:hypothetical protein